ncbi:MAG: hypothetical protein U0787_13835 [Polyangia bacterium]
MSDKSEWTGTAKDLRAELDRKVDDTRSRPGWPKDETRLSGLLRRIAPNLRDRGLDIKQVESRAGIESGSSPCQVASPRSADLLLILAIWLLSRWSSLRLTIERRDGSPWVGDFPKR